MALLKGVLSVRTEGLDLYTYNNTPFNKNNTSSSNFDIATLRYIYLTVNSICLRCKRERKNLTKRVTPFRQMTVRRNSALCTLHSAFKKAEHQSGSYIQLHNRLLIDNKSEGEPELFGGFAAHYHSSEKNLKVIHYRAVLGINRKTKGHGFAFLVYS